MDTICDVIVLTWNQLDVIKAFVESYLANTVLLSRLIIIDNASSDGTKDYLLSLGDTASCKFEVILNKENRGFVGGMNQGIEISKAPYVCLANNDLIFTKGWLEEIIDIFEKHGNVGLLNPNSNNLGLHSAANVTIDDCARMLKNNYSGVFVEMPFCIGFCMFIRRELINKVGGLSVEFYPIFFEDSDYSMKAAKANYLIGMAKASYVWHKEHASFKQMGENKEKFFVRSREVFFKKWGKILRIVYVINNYRDLQDGLQKSIELARNGNYVWIFCKDLDKKREDIFKDLNITEHTGVQFVSFKNNFGLMWDILKKKKKYDLVIIDNKIVQNVLKGLRYNVLDKLQSDRIKNLRKFS